MTQVQHRQEGGREAALRLPAGRLVPAWVALILLALLGWFVTIQQASGIGVGPGTIVLIAVGVMDIPAMILLATVIFVEKIWRRGEALSKAVGVVFIACALLVLFAPRFAPGLHVNVTSNMTSMGGT